MRPIPSKMRQQLADDPRMKKCVLAGQTIFGSCEGRIEWEHVWIYAGKQINELWAIIGACHKHHLMKDQQFAVQDEFQRISLALATPANLEAYPRKNWLQIKKYLGVDNGIAVSQ